jgi:ferredoxin--NADP+ reductase
MHFLASPTRILDDGTGRVGGLEVEENTLVLKNGEVKARGLGTRHVLDVDTVIFAIGDRVDETLGLPVHWDAYDKNPSPRFPVEGESYEAYDSERNLPIEGIFVAGWSRNASSGLVGVARKDGTNGARAILQYLRELPPADLSILNEIRAAIYSLDHPVVDEEALAVLEKIEQERAQFLGVEEFKFSSNREMLEAMGLLPVTP